MPLDSPYRYLAGGSDEKSGEGSRKKLAFSEDELISNHAITPLSHYCAMLETVVESIYDHPKYYDLVFGADCAAETRFIEQCAQQFAKGKVKKLFEPACGTGDCFYHLAKTRLSRFRLDINPKAVDFCNARLERHEIKDRAFVGDMSCFTTKTKYDLAFNTINSFRHHRPKSKRAGTCSRWPIAFAAVACICSVCI